MKLSDFLDELPLNEEDGENLDIILEDGYDDEIYKEFDVEIQWSRGRILLRFNSYGK